MKWDETLENGVTLIHLEGEIDLNHSPKLRAFFQGKIREKCPSLLLDFANVSYIDSSGLATLVEYYQGSRAYDGKIVLRALSARVKSGFDLVRLSEIFTIEQGQGSCTPSDAGASQQDYRPAPSSETKVSLEGNVTSL
jgi:anti-sigma B factor antagonist